MLLFGRERRRMELLKLEKGVMVHLQVKVLLMLCCQKIGERGNDHWQ